MKKQLLASVCWQPGPWARYQNTFTTLIKDLGYAPGSIQNQTQLITKFAEWLRRQTETKIHCLDETTVQRFLRSQQNRGYIVEMQTGEGKALAAVPAVIWYARQGRGAHVLTANDYLARRDALWMRGIYDWFGLSVARISQTIPQSNAVWRTYVM
jgi:preprotein translocase subunit SecA